MTELDRSTAHDSWAVRAEALVFAYPGGWRRAGRQALDGVGFAVREGLLYGVLGPNGSGKSTLFRILATLARPKTGRLEMLGRDVAANPRAARAGLGVVFQSPSLDVHLTVEENLRVQGRLLGLDHRAIAAASDRRLAALGVAERRGALVKTLSGGLKRRVELAKALLSSPRLLLLDEPSTGLDPSARADLRRILLDLREQGTTVLLTTHLMEEADLCDELLLLDQGRVVAAGPPAQLRAAVGGDVLLVRARDDRALQTLASAMAELLAHQPPPGPGGAGPPEGRTAAAAIQGRPGENLLRLEHPAARTLASVLLARFADTIESLSIQRPTLEDVFLHLTGHGLAGEGGPAGGELLEGAA